jgi:hypothetical protein
MNSSSVRVEWPIVSTTGEGFALGVLFPSGTVLLELVLGTLIVSPSIPLHN